MFLKWTIFNSCLDFAPRPPELVVKTKNKKAKNEDDCLLYIMSHEQDF